MFQLIAMIVLKEQLSMKLELYHCINNKALLGTTKKHLIFPLYSLKLQRNSGGISPSMLKLVNRFKYDIPGLLLKFSLSC